MRGIVNHNLLFYEIDANSDSCLMATQQKQSRQAKKPAKEKADRPKWSQRLELAFAASDFKDQRSLAKHLGVSQQAISAWMTGDREPNLSMIQKLADALQVRPEWLSFGVRTAAFIDREKPDDDPRLPVTYHLEPPKKST